MTKSIINISKLSKIYNENNNIISILKDINLNITKGDIISIIGPSGSGKSTLLNILGFLDSEFIGEYHFLGKNSKKIKLNEKNIIRNRSIGFVHQFFHLIPELNILENICLPMLIKKNDYKKSFEAAEEIITNFKLQDRMYAKPNNLSGGEKQRVAIARALINNPDIIIADEMTGNLDKKTGESVFNFFLEQIKIKKQTLVYVTHNNNFAKKANIVYEINNQNLIKI